MELAAAEYGGISGYTVGHSGEEIMPVSLFNTHPEYFALGAGGQRIIHNANPCFSQEGVLDLYTEYALTKLEACAAGERMVVDVIAPCLNSSVIARSELSRIPKSSALIIR